MAIPTRNPAELNYKSADRAYVTKDNIAAPGSLAQRTAIRDRADAAIEEEQLPQGATVASLPIPPAE